MMRLINKKYLYRYFTLPVKDVLLLFFLLSVLVLVLMFLSSSKLFVIVDISLRTRTGVIATMNNLVKITSPDVANAGFRITENDRRRLNQRKFPTNEEIVHTNSQIDSVESRNEALVKVNNINDTNTLSKLSSSQNHSRELRYSFDKLLNYSSTKTEYILKFSERNYLKSHHNLMADKHGAVLQRPNTCDNCFIHNFSYAIHNNRICSLSSEDTVDVVILIVTAHEHSTARNALRSTWLTHARNNTSNVRYVFLLGEITNETQRENILRENEIYHDIIKQDFIDTYKNLTYKTIMGFKWVTANCAHARYVMKTDDDTFVNIPNLLKIFKQLGSKIDKKVIGSCAKYAKPIRNPNSKWYASFSSYPETYYPGYCSGTGYAMTTEVASKISFISPNVPFFHLEDVYVALCIRQLGYLLQTVPGFNAGRPKVNPCVYKGEKLVTAHHFSPVMLKGIWHQACSKSIWQS